MLSDPNLPQLPLPTATSLCSLSLFISVTTFHSPIHPLSGVGNYTCGSPQTSAPPSSACTKMAFCGDPDDSTWIHWNDWLWFILCHAMQRWHFSVTSVCASTDSLSTWHINIQFFFIFFFTVSPFLTWKLGFLWVNPLIHSGKGWVGFWRFDWQRILCGLKWSISHCQM